MKNSKSKSTGLELSALVTLYLTLGVIFCVHIGIGLIAWKYFPYIYMKWVGENAMYFFGRMIGIALVLASLSRGFIGIWNFNDDQKGNGIRTLLISAAIKVFLGAIFLQFFIGQEKEAMFAILSERGPTTMVGSSDMEVTPQQLRAIWMGPVGLIIFAQIMEWSLLNATAGKLKGFKVPSIKPKNNGYKKAKTVYDRNKKNNDNDLIDGLMNGQSGIKDEYQQMQKRKTKGDDTGSKQWDWG